MNVATGRTSDGSSNCASMAATTNGSMHATTMTGGRGVCFRTSQADDSPPRLASGSAAGSAIKMQIAPSHPVANAPPMNARMVSHGSQNRRARLGVRIVTPVRNPKTNGPTIRNPHVIASIPLTVRNPASQSMPIAAGSATPRPIDATVCHHQSLTLRSATSGSVRPSLVTCSVTLPTVAERGVGGRYSSVTPPSFRRHSSGTTTQRIT